MVCVWKTKTQTKQFAQTIQRLQTPSVHRHTAKYRTSATIKKSYAIHINTQTIKHFNSCFPGKAGSACCHCELPSTSVHPLGIGQNFHIMLDTT